MSEGTWVGSPLHRTLRMSSGSHTVRDEAGVGVCVGGAWWLEQCGVPTFKALSGTRLSDSNEHIVFFKENP